MMTCIVALEQRHLGLLDCGKGRQDTQYLNRWVLIEELEKLNARSRGGWAVLPLSSKHWASKGLSARTRLTLPHFTSISNGVRTSYAVLQ